MLLTSWEWEHFIGSFAEIWCLLSQPPTDTTDYCVQGLGHTAKWDWSLDSWGKSIRSIGYVCGQEVVASQREKRAVFGAELPQIKYLTRASLIQVQLPDSRTGTERYLLWLCYYNLVVAISFIWYSPSLPQLGCLEMVGISRSRIETMLKLTPPIWLIVVEEHCCCLPQIEHNWHDCGGAEMACN